MQRTVVINVAFPQRASGTEKKGEAGGEMSEKVESKGRGTGEPKMR